MESLFIFSSSSRFGKGIVQMKYKHSIHRVLLMIFAVGVGSYIVVGKRGVMQYISLQEELAAEIEYVKKMEQTCTQLQADATTWQENSFELEKLARQDLHMGYTNEVMYYFPTEYIETHTAQGPTQDHDERIT